MSQTIRIQQPVAFEARKGRRCILAGPSFPENRPDVLLATAPLPGVKVGAVLSDPQGVPCFRAVSRLVWPGPEDGPSPFVILLEALETFVISPGEARLSLATHGYALAWITMSDKGSRGQRADEAGPLIAAMTGARLSLRLVRGHVVPDEAGPLKALLTDLALIQGFDLIVTTGGTGLAPRDVTPEATLAVLEKRLPGFEAAMTAASLAKTPHAAISRATAGTLGESLIINLPGSPKAVRENLEAVLPAIKHALDKLQGDASDCAAGA